jgi:ABC-2 type transport system permease protein
MKARRVLAILGKDLALGPRSPIVLFAFVIPLGLTLMVQLVFGELLTGKPSVGIADPGASGLYERVLARGELMAYRYDGAEALRADVASGRVALGIAVGEGFLPALREGRRPPLEIMGFEGAQAMDRMAAFMGVLGEIRALAGDEPLVGLKVEAPEEGFDIAARVIPMLAMYAFLIAGLFVPASSIVEERERKTISALLVGPTTLSEILAAKALLGIILSVFMTTLTLAINGALGSNLGAMLAVIAAASLFWAMLGLVIGLLAKTSETLFAIVKGSGILLFTPVVFYLFPDWPQWIARIFPTFWAIDPLWKVFSEGAGLSEVAGSLAIVAGITLICFPATALLGKRLKDQLGA